jgi:hypothetical protein
VPIPNSGLEDAGSMHLEGNRNFNHFSLQNPGKPSLSRETPFVEFSDLETPKERSSS